jgi:hypothetical protein
VSKLEGDITAAMDALKQLEADAMEVGEGLEGGGFGAWGFWGAEGGGRRNRRAQVQCSPNNAKSIAKQAKSDAKALRDPPHNHTNTQTLRS